MNSSGGIHPRIGWFHRARSSKPCNSPVHRLKSAWKYGMNSPFAKALSTSRTLSIAILDHPNPLIEADYTPINPEVAIPRSSQNQGPVGERVIVAPSQKQKPRSLSKWSPRRSPSIAHVATALNSNEPVEDSYEQIKYGSSICADCGQSTIVPFLPSLGLQVSRS